MFLLTFLAYCISLLVLACIGLCLFFYYSDWQVCQDYRKRGIPYVKTSYHRVFQLLSGNTTLLEADTVLYQESVQTGHPCVAVPEMQMYMITDLDLTRSIFIKDFDHFSDHRKLSSVDGDILNKMLGFVNGEQWKGLRSQMSPIFTTGKIKRMFSILETSSNRLCQYLEKDFSGKDIDICTALSKYTIDLIANCAFAIDSKTFECEAGITPDFEKMAARINFEINFTAIVKSVVMLTFPKLAEWLNIQTFDTEATQYFDKVIKQVIAHRRKTGQKYDDFLQLMMDAQEGLLKNEENLKETLEVMTGTSDDKSGTTLGNKFAESSKNLKIVDDHIVANSLLFLLGGYETTLSLLTFTAYTLALNQECQDKLREEVKQALEENKGKVTYESVQGMSYLDAIINETLRLYPSGGRNERLCTKDYKLPIENGYVIEKGSIIAMSVYPMHRDPRFWENPEKFDPERFMPERKGNILPYSFAPFGLGPRNCIGMRFALTQAKAAIAALIHKFRLEPCSKTDIPAKFANVSTLKPANGMWLNIQTVSEE